MDGPEPSHCPAPPHAPHLPHVPPVPRPAHRDFTNSANEPRAGRAFKPQRHSRSGTREGLSGGFARPRPSRRAQRGAKNAERGKGACVRLPLCFPRCEFRVPRSRRPQLGYALGGAAGAGRLSACSPGRGSLLAVGDAGWGDTIARTRGRTMFASALRGVPRQAASIDSVVDAMGKRSCSAA